MSLVKGFLQGTIILLWMSFVVARLVATLASPGDGPTDPTAGVGLISEFLSSIPFGWFVIPTAIMIGAVVGLELVFALLPRR